MSMEHPKNDQNLAFKFDQKAIGTKDPRKKEMLFRKSMHLYKKAFREGDLQSIKGLAMAYLHSKKISKALALYQKGLKRAPKKSKHTFLNGLGNTYRYQGDYGKQSITAYRKAIRYYKEAIRSKPLASIYWSNLSVAYASLKDWNNALNANKKAIALIKRNREHKNMLKLLKLERDLYSQYKKLTLL